MNGLVFLMIIHPSADNAQGCLSPLCANATSKVPHCHTAVVVIPLRIFDLARILTMFVLL